MIDPWYGLSLYSGSVQGGGDGQSLVDSFLRWSVGDSNGTGRNFLSAVGDGGADFGDHTGAGGGESNFFWINSCEWFCSDQTPEIVNYSFSLIGTII